MAAKKKIAKKVVKKTVVKKAKAAKKAVKKNVKQKSAKSKPTKKAIAAKPAKKTSTVKAVSKPVSKAVALTKVKSPAPKVITDYSKAITPLLDRLVVRVVNSERITAGGLIIPETALLATGYLKAEVLAIGTGIKSKKGYLKPLDVKVGDMVLFAEYAGTRVQFNSEDLHIIHESDVMGILQD